MEKHGNIIIDYYLFIILKGIASSVSHNIVVLAEDGVRKGKNKYYNSLT